MMRCRLLTMMVTTVISDSTDPAGEPRYQLGELRASSPAMGKIYALLGRLAPGPTPILIRGETGTGKETLAFTVHGLSAARTASSIRCTGLTTYEFRLQLTGGDQPATLAKNARSSLILLDVGSLSLESQEVLISRLGPQFALSRKRMVPVAGARLICTSTHDLGGMVRRGQFRADLYYRLVGAEVTIPPLRQRRDDIEQLAREFFARGQHPQVMSSDALQLLLGYSWPGNVRQFLQVLQAAATIAPADLITEASISRFMTPVLPAKDISVPLGTKLASAERLVVQATLAAHGGNRQETADTLGIARRTLYEKLREYRSQPGRDDCVTQQPSGASEGLS